MLNAGRVLSSPDLDHVWHRLRWRWQRGRDVHQLPPQKVDVEEPRSSRRSEGSGTRCVHRRTDVAPRPAADGVLVMTAVGLLAAEAEPYLALRSFLFDRVDSS